MPDPTQRFSDRVENYVKYRPSYPAALIDCLREHAGLNRTSVVADIGSGTGIFTALLLPAAGRVHAVEPNAAMRAAAERDLGAQSGFVSVDGTAETTALPTGSVDLVTAAQAFHWFRISECRAEFVRILRPGGRVALIWNERLTDKDPFSIAYEKLLKTAATNYDQVDHRRIDQTAMARFFAPQIHKEYTFPNAQVFDREGLVGRALSSSYIPNAGQPGHREFFTQLEQIFQEHAKKGRVTFEYLTRVYVGALSVASSGYGSSSW